MIQPSVLVAERVRQRLRAEGTDPTFDSSAARSITLAEVRKFNDLAMARGAAMIEDEAACVRDVLAAVSGFGPLQSLLDDPEIEEMRPLHRGFRLTRTGPSVGCPRGVSRKDISVVIRGFKRCYCRHRAGTLLAEKGR
ncbi:hypothetical protein AB0N61_00400 [Microbacterium sp. NPDC089320]|uniref:hypothetical protein n=1 Tax=Microbacterium sp. NPDC089320 TaxID=3155182 RepID=UPI00344A4DCC